MSFRSRNSFGGRRKLDEFRDQDTSVRILFKTSYLDDIRLFRHGGNVFWYGLLVACLLVAPAVLREFYVGELSQVFILAIAGVGLMLLIGYTGLASLGHGAFMGIGAYVNTYLITKGVPFLVSFPVAGLAALAAGVAVALPANRMTGIYLAIATLAFSQIVEQVVVRWESVTRGFQGMPVPPPDLFGHRLATRGSSTTCAWWCSWWWCLAPST